MVDLGKLFGGLKLSPKHLAPVAIAAGALVFGPASLVRELGVGAFVASYRGWIGVVFLATASILLTHAALVPWGGARRWLQGRDLKRRLLDLTPAEKTILRRYISGNTRTKTLDVASGVASGLESAKIIYRAAALGSMVDGFAYNIQPWAWDHLKKHANLLSGPEEPVTPDRRRLTGR